MTLSEVFQALNRAIGTYPTRSRAWEICIALRYGLATGRLSPELEKRLLDGALREVVEAIEDAWDGVASTSGVLRTAELLYPWILEDR
jgi:hypothetical protein